MIYEYREYHVLPGKMEALLERFETITFRLFEKHSIRLVGFWRTDVGEADRLYYIIAFDDLAARDRQWGAFQRDPEWIEAKRRTEADGPMLRRIVNRLWRPVPFGPKP